MADLEDSSTDWSSSDSDESELDELLNDDDTEMMLLLFGMKHMEDRAKLLDQRKGSTMGRMCIPLMVSCKQSLPLSGVLQGFGTRNLLLIS